VGFQLADAVIHAYLTGLGDFNKDNYSGGNKVTVWIFFLIATVIVQLVFMNMLIAIMAAAYEDSCAIEEQAVLKELCSMMVDNIWLLEISEIFKNSRYVLWFTPDRAAQSGTAVERQISNLRDHFKTEVETGNTKILNAI
jgi:TRAP-type C4-dicarboxylate transport system permease large subunit